MLRRGRASGLSTVPVAPTDAGAGPTAPAVRASVGLGSSEPLKASVLSERRMAGAEFVRVDLHVHTFPDSVTDPDPDLDSYIDAAIAAGVRVLGVTDHNTAQFAVKAVVAAQGKELLVLPGVEISTHDGHLLGLFAPTDVDALAALAHPDNLRLKEISETEARSQRSMLDLIGEIDGRGGLAIPAHVDAGDGMAARMSPSELQEVLTHPGLAGLEFARPEALATWFTDDDEDEHRRVAWKARQNVAELRDRGLARVMSSDAHSVDKVGQDRALRTLTRLRLDDVNFDAVRNAVLLNPKARCKAEATLPITYPRVVSASFVEGFLDGVTLEFSPNLNCLIGGRGSGKSTALLAIRAALGATLGPDEDADDVIRMPEETRVTFVDRAGSERTAVRNRGMTSVDADSGSPISLRLADLGQDESGRLARGYDENPLGLLAFLDGFVVKHRYDEADEDLLAKLDENAAEVTRTSISSAAIRQREEEHAKLEATLAAAEKGNIESLAEWARILAAQAPLLERLDEELARASRASDEVPAIDIDALALEYGVDLEKRGKTFVEGAEGLREQLGKLHESSVTIRKEASGSLEEAGEGARKALELWKTDQSKLREALDAKQKELEAKGLTVQAGAIREIADRLNVVKQQIVELKGRQKAHRDALKVRASLLSELRTNRDLLHAAREATLKRICAAASAQSEGLTIRVSFDRAGLDESWARWLGVAFNLRSPRVQRLAAKISPGELAEKLVNNPDDLVKLKDGSEPFLTQDAVDDKRQWQTIFTLETMRLEDKPTIVVQEAGVSKPKGFQNLSAGQQRSVLLGLLLCAERDEPLIVDQPEDHLDAQYIANAVVRHLEAAKERRQVIIATHSANLTVLGDAELVIPLRVEDGHGEPFDFGAVDRPETRAQVCALLEGGIDAFRRRGERYGFRFSAIPDS